MTSTSTGFAGASRVALLAGVAALTLPAVAHAQGTTPADQAAADAAAAAVRDDTNVGNEIVVTATKREQTLQDVPVAVSVTTAQTIERAQIRDISDLASVVPSLRVNQNQSQFATRYSVRGFGTDGNNLGLEPSVAMFVDGVYRSRAVAQISDLPDIQRVEVLRGPQSTLFGKNASAGVISIVTKEPSFRPGGSVEASYGNYNAMYLKGYLTGPIGDSIAASLAGGYSKRDGYLTNAFNGDDMNNRNRWFARGQVLFQPSDAFKFRLIGDYDEIKEKCCGVVNLQASAATNAVRAVGGQVNDFRDPYADIVYSDVVPTSQVKNWGVSGQADYEFGGVTLTSITAYRKTRINADQDVDFTSARLASGANVGQANLKTFTQELRLASNFDGPINFLLGGYYFDETVKTADQIVYGADFRNYLNLLIGGPVTSPPNDLAVDNLEATLTGLTGTNYINRFWQPGQGFFNQMQQKDKAYSIFGNVDFEPVDGLTLTVGANYTKDKKKLVTNSVSTDVFSGVDLVSAGRTAIYSQALATTVGQALRLPTGTLATAAQIGAFAAAQPAAYQQIVAGSTAFAAANATNAAVNPLLALRRLQFLQPFQNCPNAVESCAVSDGDWSYNVRLAYEISRTLNVYASWATGYKAASFNLSRDSRPNAADTAALRTAGLAVANLTAGSRFAAPEDSTVYELGIKGNWGLAAANLTFFKQSIKNFQTNTFTGSGFLFANAEKQSTFGIEFDGYVRPVDELTLSLAMTYLDPKYDSFVNSPVGDLSGQTVAGISRITSVVGAQWDQPMGNGDHLILRGDFSYSSPVQITEGLTGFITTNADGTPNFATARAAARPFRREVSDLNASLTYVFDMGLEVSVWGRNLLNDRYVSAIFDSVAQSGSVSGYTNQPRTYGVSARFKF